MGKALEKAVFRGPVADDSTCVPDWLLALLATLVYVSLCLALIFLVPKFRQVFEDVSVELPVVTVAVLEIGRFAADYWVLLPLPALCAPALLLAGWRRAAACCSFVLGSASLLVLTALPGALLLPLMKLLEKQ